MLCKLLPISNILNTRMFAGKKKPAPVWVQAFLYRLTGVVPASDLANSEIHADINVEITSVVTVRIREEGDDEAEVFKIVGEPSDTFNEAFIEVSVGSPMGEALVRARVGDFVRVDTPRGAKRFEVLEIL